MNQEFYDNIDIICDKDGRYKRDVYSFVMDALSFAQRKFRCSRHVTGEQLLEGMRELLLHKFGPMTMTVLKHWGIHTTNDFGNVVFNLVENRLLSKTSEDNIESFKDRYDFKEVFDHSYREQLARRISRMR